LNAGRTVLENVKILYGRDFSLVEGYIAFEQGLIVEVGRGSFQGEVEKRLNGRGLLAIPGLINAHTHLGDSAAKELALGLTLKEAVAPPDGLKHRLLRSLKAETLTRWMEETLRDMAATGTTCFADFRENGVQGITLLGEALKKVRIEGLILARPSSPEKVKDELESLAEVADGIGIGSLSQYSDQALSLIAERLKGFKLLAAHAAEASSGEVERAVKRLRADLLVHLTNAEDWELEMAAEAGVGVAVCPRSNATLGVGLPNVKRMVELGLKVGLGTDNVMVCQPDMFREMEFTSRVLRLKYGPSYPPPEQVFKMATLWGAEALKLGDRLGSLEEGKQADVVLLDVEASNVAPIHNLMASLIHRVRAENVMLVLVRGEVAYSRLPPEAWKLKP